MDEFDIQDGVFLKYHGPGGDVVIPESMISIGEYAFSGCGSLLWLILPESIQSPEGMKLDDESIPNMLAAPGFHPDQLDPEIKDAAALGFLCHSDRYKKPGIVQAYEAYIQNNYRRLVPPLCAQDLVHGLKKLMELVPVSAQSFEEDILRPVMESDAFDCKACLLEWANGNLALGEKWELPGVPSEGTGSC